MSSQASCILLQTADLGLGIDRTRLLWDLRWTLAAVAPDRSSRAQLSLVLVAVLASELPMHLKNNMNENEYFRLTYHTRCLLCTARAAMPLCVEQRCSVTHPGPRQPADSKLTFSFCIKHQILRFPESVCSCELSAGADRQRAHFIMPVCFARMGCGPVDRPVRSEKASLLILDHRPNNLVPLKCKGSGDTVGLPATFPVLLPGSSTC